MHMCFSNIQGCDPLVPRGQQPSWVRSPDRREGIATLKLGGMFLRASAFGCQGCNPLSGLRTHEAATLKPGIGLQP